MPVLKQHEVFAGRYLLDQLVGEGGFSEVWQARDLMADDAVVAIKIYAAAGGLDDWGLRQFKNEFSLTHNLSHPHLLKVNHFDVADGSPYLIMTYCPHGSVGEGLRNKGVYTERQVARVMYQIGAALEEIHRQNPPIIHQDIKPDNILLLQPDTFMLADFGISSRIRHTLSRTAIQAQALTVAYAPPERFDRHPTADAPSDIFSLGVTLYEMCTNTVPWEGAGGQCLLKGAKIPALPVGFSPALSRILEACMSLDRSKRPTATEIRQQGLLYLETGQWQRAKPKRSLFYLNKAVAASFATAVVAFAATAGVVYYDQESIELPENIIASGPVRFVAKKIEKPAVLEKVERVASVEEKTPAAVEKPKPAQARKAETKPAKRTEAARKVTRPQEEKPVAQEVWEELPEYTESEAADELFFEEQPTWEEDSFAVEHVNWLPSEADSQQVENSQQPLPQKTTAPPAAPKHKSSSQQVERPTTNNTTLEEEKESWLKLPVNSGKKKNAHQKRVRKLKRRFS